jgi:hypothetical protein
MSQRAAIPSHDGMKKLKYYVKSGSGYLTAFEGDLPVMASSRDLAREFADLDAAEASAEKVLEAGFAVSIEIEDEMVLED